MHMGMIGLGRMGGNMARRLGRSGISVHGFSLDALAHTDLSNDANIEVINRIEEMLARSSGRAWCG